MGYICLKTTFLHLKHYLQIYLTLLSTTCVKIHQIPYVIFETISHFSRHNSSVLFQFKYCILLTKISHQSSSFSDFSLLKLKYIKYLMSFFKQKVSLSSRFRLLFSVMRDNSSTFFQLELYMLLTKVAHQSANFQTSALIKIYQICHVIFETNCQFFFKLCITLHCHEKQLLCTFS